MTSSHSHCACARSGSTQRAIGSTLCPSDTADHRSQKGPKMSARSWDIYTDHQSTDDQCGPSSATCQCLVPVPINATYQCPSELPFSVTHQCQSVPPINANQCHLSVPYISAMYQCCHSVPSSDAYQ
ncbi:unnamed protein product, partial [Staurois parvus]